MWCVRTAGCRNFADHFTNSFETEAEKLRLALRPKLSRQLPEYSTFCKRMRYLVKGYSTGYFGEASFWALRSFIKLEAQRQKETGSRIRKGPSGMFLLRCKLQTFSFHVARACAFTPVCPRSKTSVFTPASASMPPQAKTVKGKVQHTREAAMINLSGTCPPFHRKYTWLRAGRCWQQATHLNNSGRRSGYNVLQETTRFGVMVMRPITTRRMNRRWIQRKKMALRTQKENPQPWCMVVDRLGSDLT